MEELAGAFGTSASFALRLGQTVFLFFFPSLNVFGRWFLLLHCFLFILSSLSYMHVPHLGILNFLSSYHAIPQLFGNSHGFGNSMEHNIYLPVQRRLIMIIFFGDMMLSCLSLAAACSTASIADLLLDAGGSHCPPKLCGRYQLSAAMAFLSWFLSSVSFLFNFWLFSSL
ncbi:CASP-like protein [Glycine max]|nr:CASP-like protein [Glycine max]